MIMKKQTIDFTLMDEAIISKKYVVREIANTFKCTSTTVNRRIKFLGCGKGRGVKNVWQFSGVVTPDLAYLIGAYITDGCIGHAYLNPKCLKGMTVSVTDKEFADRVEYSMNNVGLKVSRSITYREKPRKCLYIVATHTSMFAYWLNEICDYKNKIPNIILTSTPEGKTAFLEGVIDGDGTIRYNQVIIRSIMSWIFGLEDILKSIDISYDTYTEKTTKGKPYYAIKFKCADFVPFNPKLAIPRKHDRLLKIVIQKDTRKRVKPIHILSTCPVCKKEIMYNKTATMCIACYLVSDKSHEHLKRIAPIGNKAANIARWGTK